MKDKIDIGVVPALDGSTFSHRIAAYRERLRSMGRRNANHVIGVVFRIMTYVLLFDIAFIFIYPFLYMIARSFMSSADLWDLAVNWIPRKLELANYVNAFELMSYSKFFLNSLTYTTVGTIGHLLSCSLIGYGLARYSFPGRRLLLSLVIVAIIVPIQTIIVPIYMLFANLGWTNSILPVVVPTFFGFGLSGGLFVLIFRQFYLGLPKALEEAARIDGCGFLRTYWNIALPTVRSAYFITLVFSMVWHWHDFYEPSIFAGITMMPLPARLEYLVYLASKPIDVGMNFQEMSPITDGVLMAATFMILLPILIAFIFLQRRFIQGIERTGLVE